MPRRGKRDHLGVRPDRKLSKSLCRLRAANAARLFDTLKPLPARKRLLLLTAPSAGIRPEMRWQISAFSQVRFWIQLPFFRTRLPSRHLIMSGIWQIMYRGIMGRPEYRLRK